MNILVLCTGNDARSILLESILNDEAPNGITAYSAGSVPADAVHPAVLALLEANDHDTSDLTPSDWRDYAGDDAMPVDLVITLCSETAAKKAPAWPNAPATGYWDIANPVGAADEEAAITATFEQLQRRAKALLKHPIETMDAGELTAALKRIAKQA